MSTAESSGKPQLIAAGKHHTITLQQAIQVFLFQNILPGAYRYYANIGAAYSRKGMVVTFAYFVGYTRCSSNHFYTCITATHFLHYPAQDAQFKKVKIVLMNISFLC